ncbi:hypothetical protein KG112_10625 [Nocardioides sp. zg-ZUI104]|uniref:hypothetical protein n=1 Tax=Nocardioides faecalis TaxID=2803858 RepID=UPI001BCE4C54|nr:hypothetical protein [Nocardioides faecalis]MBS4753255.1 hypothetical protein [Nocardioides faecalis]
MHPTHIPLRVATGAYILSSGLDKLGADEGTAQYLHGSAAAAYPVFQDMPPQKFAKLLACSEIAVGAALLAPVVPATLAGAALTGFGSSLVGMYLRTPSMTREDGIRPSPDGIGLAKDAWLVGGGLTLLAQGLWGAAKSGAKSSKKAVRRATPGVG